MSRKSTLGLPPDITPDEAYIAGVADGEESTSNNGNFLKFGSDPFKERKEKKPKVKHYTVTVVGMITIDVETSSVAEAYELANRTLDNVLREIDADLETFYSHARKADYQ